MSLLDLDSPSPAAAAGAAAFSTDGSTMAIGYVDDTIMMLNRVEPLPVHEIRDVAGRARDAITVDDKLIVATNEGVLQELDWRTDLATYQGAVAEARSRLQAAHSAGLSD